MKSNGTFGGHKIGGVGVSRLKWLLVGDVKQGYCTTGLWPVSKVLVQAI